MDCIWEPRFISRIVTTSGASHNSFSHMNTSHRLKPAHPLTSWLFSLVSVAIALVLAIAGIAYSLRLSSGDVYKQIAETLSQQQWPAVRQLLAEASQSLPLDRWVYSERELLARGIRVTAAREMLLLLDQAKSPKLSVFSSTFDRLLRALNGMDEQPPRLQALVTTAEQTASGIVSLWKERDQVEIELAAIDQDIRSAVRSFFETRNRFARALGLPYDEQLPPGISRPIPYSEGVLKGLPTLGRLKDGLKDLSELKDELSTLGGQVAYTGESAAEDFKAELVSLQILTRKALDDYDGRTLRKATLEERRTTISDEMVGRIPRLNVVGSEIVLALAAENWPPSGNE